MWFNFFFIKGGFSLVALPIGNYTGNKEQLQNTNSIACLKVVAPTLPRKYFFE